ncbi:PEPxxWA-CTERM sorting domain-containing protein [Sphingomonas tabacisoli]|uniref:PEPxxWA-CTERM sorting domain-containing protein n=1 Tax=Sphingomonas tabacisoli TaxID=2249466 RepID=A0ABW4I055_9SPHN
MWAAPSAAAIVTEVSIQNTYSFANANKSVPVTTGGSTETFYEGATDPGQAELGVNYTATADKGGFFFLHDNYCVGACQTSSSTVITFTVTNTGDGPVDLRFDSQITPGHIAEILADGSQRGSFNFRVTRNVVGAEPSTLYSANGGVNSDGIFLNTGGLTFNNLIQQSDPDGRWKVFDWSTTNLSVPIGQLAGGQTVEVSYIATYNTTSDATCTDIFACPGLQVVFGDPRNDGGVTNLAGRGDVALDDNAIYPVIGRNYDPHFVAAQVVTSDTPLPNDPPGLPKTNYGPLFDPRVLGVPEPATWAMMIGGFGMIGSMARRRKVRPAAIC